MDGTGQVVIQELEDERGVWIALTRQIILDCQYLDSGTESCRPGECDASLPHADGVAESVLGILDSHFDKAFDKRILTLKVMTVMLSRAVRKGKGGGEIRVVPLLVMWCPICCAFHAECDAGSGAEAGSMQ